MYVIYMYLCHFFFGPIIIQMRRTDARWRRTDAHNLKVYCNEGYGRIWWIFDGNYACLMGFCVGFGWFLDGFFMVNARFWMDVRWMFDGPWWILGWCRIDFDAFWMDFWWVVASVLIGFGWICDLGMDFERFWMVPVSRMHMCILSLWL